MTADDPVATARSLLQDVRADPAADDVATLHELLETADPSARRTALSALRTVASRDPPLFRAEFEDDLEIVHSLCTDPDATVRAGGADLLTTIAAKPAEPSASVSVSSSTSARSDGTLERISTLLVDDSRLVRRQTLEGLQQIGSAAPERVCPFVDDVAPFLEADDPAIVKHAVVILAQAATADGASVSAVVPTLFDLIGRADDSGSGRESGDESTSEDEIESENESAGPALPSDAMRSTDLRHRIDSARNERLSRRRLVRQLSGHAICQVAVADPDAITPMTETLSTLLADPDPQVRIVVAETVLALAERRPSAIGPYRTTLATRLETDGAETVRGRLAQALAVLGVDDPAAVGACVVGAVDALWPLLEHDDPPVRGAAANLLALAASVGGAGEAETGLDVDADTDAGLDTDPHSSDHPSTIVAPAVDRLETLLDDDVEYVRAAAADALESGGLGSGSSSRGGEDGTRSDESPDRDTGREDET